jgi:hypothetical protein
MISKTFTKRALMGLGAGAMALGALATTGCVRDANAADSATPSKIEQVSGYSYGDALARSANGAVLYYGADIVEADDVAGHIAVRTNVTADAIPGNDDPNTLRLLIFGEEIGVYDQDGLDGGDVGATATLYINRSMKDPRRVSALTAQPN